MLQKRVGAQSGKKFECSGSGEADHAPSYLLRGRKIQTLAMLQERVGAKATK
jgi:hypothetical protein